MHEHIAHLWRLVTLYIEKGIALFVLIGVIMYVLASVPLLLSMDWSATATLYEFIHRILIAMIGLELVRLLVTHSIAAVLELLAFVIARKMLKPDLTSVDIFLSVLAFVALMAARHYFTEPCFLEEEERSSAKMV